MQQCYLHFNHSNRLNNFIFMSVFSSSVYFNGCTASCQQNECVPEHLFSANWGFETMSLKMFSKIKYLKWDIRWKEPARMFHFIRRNIKLILRSNCNEFLRVNKLCIVYRKSTGAHPIGHGETSWNLWEFWWGLIYWYSTLK